MLYVDEGGDAQDAPPNGEKVPVDRPGQVSYPGGIKFGQAAHENILCVQKETVIGRLSLAISQRSLGVGV